MGSLEKYNNVFTDFFYKSLYKIKNSVGLVSAKIICLSSTVLNVLFLPHQAYRV